MNDTITYLEKLIKNLANPCKYVQISSLDEYFKLPVSQRTKWFNLYYLEPSALPSKMFQNDDDKSGTWEDFHKWAKAHYPIQFYFRETFPTYFYPVKWKWNDFRWKIYYIFRPQHPNLHKLIGRGYVDSTYLIPNLLFQIVIDFVEIEREGKIELQKVEENEELERPLIENWNKFYGELQNCYDYVKFKRAKLNEQLDAALSIAAKDRSNKDYDIKYADMIRIENEIKENDDKWLNFITDNRESFWT